MSSLPREREARPAGAPYGIRLRVWVGGELVVSEWIHAGNAEEAATRHAAATIAAAGGADKELMCEVFDPDLSGPDAFLRFGTTAEGMSNPVMAGRGSDPETQRRITDEYEERLRAGRRFQ